MDAGPTQRKLLHRKSTLSLHLSSFLGGREKGIQEPTVVQLPPTPDSETTPTIISSEATSPDTDREGGMSTANTSVAVNSKTTDNKDVDQGSQAPKMERRKSRLSMLIPSFLQEGTALKGTTGASKLHKQQRPVTANPLLSMAPVTAANPGAQQATTPAKSTNGTNGRPSTSVSAAHNKKYSSPDGLGTNPTNSSPPLSSLQTGWFLSRSIFLSFSLTNHLEHKVRASTMPLEKTNPSTSPGPATRPVIGTGSRSVSVEGPPPGAAIPPNRLQKQQDQQQPPLNSSPTSSTGHSRGRSTSSQPPVAHHRTPSAEPPRIVSTSVDSRPTSTHSNGSDDSGPTAQKHKQRRSWFGGRSRSNSEVNKGDSNAAWIVAPDSKADYSTANLLNGEKV